jgi:hypothetical protein
MKDFAAKYWKDALLIGLACYVLYGIHMGQVAEARAEGVEKGEKQVRAIAGEQFKAAEDSHAKTEKELREENARLKTAKQAVRIETKYQPLIVPAAEVERSQLSGVTLPDAPGMLTVRTEPQEMEVGKLVLSLESCKNDSKLCEARATKAETDAASWKRQSEQWEKTAKGGSRWSRLWRSSLKIGAGAAAGYALGRAGR